MTGETADRRGRPRMQVATVHALIRFGACLGLAVLVARRVLYLQFPGFLPSKAWLPSSGFAKWAGIAVNSGTELILQLLLLGLPIFLCVALRVDRAGGARARLLVDGMFSSVFYISSYFLLAPPVR